MPKLANITTPQLIFVVTIISVSLHIILFLILANGSNPPLISNPVSQPRSIELSISSMGQNQAIAPSSPIVPFESTEKSTNTSPNKRVNPKTQTPPSSPTAVSTPALATTPDTTPQTMPQQSGATPSASSPSSSSIASTQNSKEPTSSEDDKLIAPSTKGSHLNNPKPKYPEISKRLQEEGKVLLKVFILASGQVGEIKLQRSSGYDRLDNAAIQAVKQWRYTPAKRGGQAIDYWHTQPIEFNLS